MKCKLTDFHVKLIDSVVGIPIRGLVWAEPRGVTEHRTGRRSCWWIVRITDHKMLVFTNGLSRSQLTWIYDVSLIPIHHKPLRLIRIWLLSKNLLPAVRFKLRHSRTRFEYVRNYTLMSIMANFCRPLGHRRLKLGPSFK